MTEQPTDPAEIFDAQAALVPDRRVSFDFSARRDALLRLKQAIIAREGAIIEAIGADFGKHPVEVRLTEIVPIYQEIGDALRHLRRWMRPKRVMPGLTMFGTSGRIQPTPKGTSLIIAPWNFPFMLALGPLVSALAAGCSAVIKPSEMTPATSAVIADVIAEAFEPDLVAVVQGGPDVANALLEQPFDHIFFTGSPAVGKIVMAAAAKTLASVTLELGGKSPVVVGPEANVHKAAKWIAWGRFINAGQTCVAPDHVYVHESIHDALADALRARITKMYGTDPTQSPALAKIINPRHWARLTGLIADAEGKGATRAIGTSDEASRKISPTILLDTQPDMEISREEIFGPVLPLIKYSDLSDVIGQINDAPHPLALYVFGDAETADRVTNGTTSGSVGVNLTILPVIHPNLPFGGVGNSGMGAAHGKAGFDAFSHLRPVLQNRFIALPMIFPPYTSRVEKLSKFLLRFVGR
ncbi:aldehyde dehydrogenase (NAD+) [Yoonia maritima]|uniref:Aldehyde dehydrogenase n=1 Tax=Yoonia maritima TaxID=1435347 RepID=A0A2T0W0Q6_9RHOB|nr:aldehyde dehydrogenase family protein [Yoonia maritima]PRY78396.1 aldehyde dehydrogenase (NAD+) [Yoonia maritima]